MGKNPVRSVLLGSFRVNLVKFTVKFFGLAVILEILFYHYPYTIYCNCLCELHKADK